jgi:beta-glucanase (GH16 family)
MAMLVPSLVALAIAAPKWKLTFSQEFDGAKGVAPDPAVWARDLGGHGFGNNEMESYTDGAKNAFLNGSGYLVIEARKEPTTGADGIRKDYSSARLKTQGKFSQLYGKFEARLWLPKGKGIWPAFWMLGDNIGTAGWPKCGEIDIIEFLGHDVKTSYGTLHGPGYSGGEGVQRKMQGGEDLSAGFHTYAVEWEPEEIRFYVDGKSYGKITPEDISESEWVYNKPQFMILNLAVGGHWPGYPDATTTFPQRMLVDYIRAYKDENLVVDAAAIEKRRLERIARANLPLKLDPIKVPGDLPFANFMAGGPGVAYKDSDPGNNGGSYRKTEQVDIGASGDGAFRYSVGWTGAGEWMKYEIDVAAAGAYKGTVRVASEGDGGTFHFEIDGKQVGQSVTVPNTGGWTNWRTVYAGSFTLPKGKSVLKLVMDSNGAKTNSVGNLLLLNLAK